jgi:hypothetical protein
MSKKKSRRQVAAERFRRDLAVRGESAKLTPAGKLPARATHVEHRNAGGSPRIRRARLKAW